MDFRGAHLLAALAAALAILAVPASAGSPTPPAGFDLFETDPEMTVFSFTDDFAIPAGFFDSGSERFRGNVNFSGVPMNEFNNMKVGDADTLVRRLEPAQLTGPGTSDMVPIQIVGLSLQSVAPIQVQVGGETQLWDVKATLSPSKQSMGSMTVMQAGARSPGGTFDSQLQVFPLFQFKRLSDGATRMLDVGGLMLSQRALDDLMLGANSVPWAPRCQRPALEVPRLNRRFCASFNADDEKVLTTEGSRLVQHGIRPAQPRLEHFKCYEVRAQTKFEERDVRLRDQLDRERARVVKPLTLCNPVKKNKEPLDNRRDHLKCYELDEVRPRFTRQGAFVRNQFGFAALTILKPEMLCVPSIKQGLRSRPKPAEDFDIDHFKCYAVRSLTPFTPFRVQLEDQFGRERPRLLRPVRLCAPAQKNRERIQHPVRHLVCYELTGDDYDLLVLTRNQFGREILEILRSQTLCVPSVKLLRFAEPPPPEEPGQPPGQPPPTPPPFKVSLDTSWQQIGTPARFVICTRVTEDPPQPQAQTKIDLTRPDGSMETQTPMTDANGVAQANFQTQQAGQHTLKAQVTKDGMSSDTTQQFDVSGPMGPRQC